MVEQGLSFHTTMVLTQHPSVIIYEDSQISFPYHYGSYAT